MGVVVARVLCMVAKILLGGSPVFWKVASALLGVIHVFMVARVLLLMLSLINTTNNYLLNKNQQKKSSKLHALYLKIKSKT